MKKIYLDYAAATPLSDVAMQAMQPYWVDLFYNPSAAYMAGRDVRQRINEARAQIASYLGARPAEITFTAGGTEANNLAIHGLMQNYPEANVVVSAIEHESVLAPAKAHEYQEVPVKPDGLIDIDALAKTINDETVLVSIMYANNEIGIIQPLREVSKLIEEVRKQRAAVSSNPLPLYFHTDACQAANYLDLHVSSLGVDMMTLNAGKIYGPKQTGLLYVRSPLTLTPIISGGGQEKGLRSGTESPANIAGFAAALSMVQNDKETERARLAQLQKHFYELLEKNLPSSMVTGSKKHRLPNNVHLTIAGQDNERLMMALDERGIQCAVGSACSASNEEPSHVLSAIGLTDKQAQSALRFTLGRATTAKDIEQTVKILASLQ